MPHVRNHPESGRFQADTTAKVFRYQILALMLFGVLALFWLDYFTNWLPAVTTLLSLGGILAWLSFVSGLIKSNRKQDFQDQFDQLIANPKFGRVLAFAFAALLLTWSFSGSLQLECGPLPATVWILGKGKQFNSAQTPIELIPNQKRKFLYFIPLFSTKRVRIITKGLPTKTLALSSGLRKQCHIPYSCYRRSILAKPLLHLTATILATSSEQTIELLDENQKLLEKEAYLGQYVIFAFGENPTLPDSILAEQAAFIQESKADIQIKSQLRSIWESPLNMAKDLDLTQHKYLCILVRNKEEAVVIRKWIDVQPLSQDHPQRFFQEFTLEGIDQPQPPGGKP